MGNPWIEGRDKGGGLPDGRRGETGKARLVLNERDVVSARSPKARIGGTPQGDAGKADGGGEVGDAGVVAHEQFTGAEARREGVQRHAAGHVETGGRKPGREALESIAFGFAANEQDVAI